MSKAEILSYIVMAISVAIGGGVIAYVLWATREIDREARDITARDERVLPSDFHLGNRE